MKPFSVPGMTLNLSDGEAPVLEFGKGKVPLQYHYSQVYFDWEW